MKFVSFSHEQKSKFGIIEKGKILDLTGKILGANTLKQLISNKNGINEAKKYASNNQGNINLNKIEFLPVIPDPGKIICVGLNYSEHVKETGKKLKRIQLFF